MAWQVLNLTQFRHTWCARQKMVFIYLFSFFAKIWGLKDLKILVFWPKECCWTNTVLKLGLCHLRSYFVLQTEEIIENRFHWLKFSRIRKCFCLKQAQFGVVGWVSLKILLTFTKIYGLQDRQWLLFTLVLSLRIYLMNLNVLNLFEYKTVGKIPKIYI